jgi:hypothetical protein
MPPHPAFGTTQGLVPGMALGTSFAMTASEPSRVGIHHIDLGSVRTGAELQRRRATFCAMYRAATADSAH